MIFRGVGREHGIRVGKVGLKVGSGWFLQGYGHSPFNLGRAGRSAAVRTRLREWIVWCGRPVDGRIWRLTGLESTSYWWACGCLWTGVSRGSQGRTGK